MGGAVWGRGGPGYATVEASLNGRPPRPLVDPTVDLAVEPRSWRPKRWVLPLDAPAVAGR